MYCNPYQDLSGGQWIKTNFHTHAGTGKGTCGSNPIDTVLDLYRSQNYGALCISNHDTYTDTSALSDETLYLIQGVEYSAESHMLTIGVGKSLHGLPHQEAVDETFRQGGFTILCHPNWIRKGYWPYDKIDALCGYAGLEIINMLIYRLSGSGLATDTWDYILKQGKLVFGFGDDDFHILSDAGRSYTDIYAKTKDFNGIKKAVDGGSFTASTGLGLEYLDLTGKTVKVKAKFPTETYIDSFEYRFVTENGTAAVTYGKTGEYEIKGENYIRVEIVGENGMMLFTQPVYKKDFFHNVIT
ncbi:MAG: hypothetical protein FWD23_03930 [Oscillospiraceae bacterium]|nr:hypothetical protein [Oscillospiraceae bacterium]